MTNDRNTMGDEVTLVIDGEEVPVTDKGWTYTRDTAESNFDDTKNPDRGITQRYPEGELEYDGRKETLEKKFVGADENKHRIIFRHDSGGGFRAKGVIINEVDSGAPGDGKRNVTISWEGEEMVPF